MMDDNKYIDDFIIDEYIDTFPTVWKGEKTYHTKDTSILYRIWNSKLFDIVIGFFTWRKFLWDTRHINPISVWGILKGGVK